MAVPSWVKSCLQSLLKGMNSVIGLTGMGMILYSLWLLRSWYIHANDPSVQDSESAPPWFIFMFLALGIFLCLIACSGHIAAETANGNCLLCYMAFVFLLIMLEAAITADIFLNHAWQEDFPDDPKWKFEEFKNFIQSNIYMCKVIGLSIIASQAVSIFLAMVLRALGPDIQVEYDSDDDSVPARLPLLWNQGQKKTSNAAMTSGLLKDDPWTIRIDDKIAR